MYKHGVGCPINMCGSCMMMLGYCLFDEGGGPIGLYRCEGDVVNEMKQMGYIHGGVIGKILNTVMRLADPSQKNGGGLGVGFSMR